MMPDPQRPSAPRIPSPLQELEDRLRRDATAQRVTTPAGLPERMVHAFESRNRTAVATSPRHFPPVMRAAAAILVGAAVLLGAVALAQRGGGASQTTFADTTSPAEPRSGPALQETGVPGRELIAAREPAHMQADSAWAGPIDGPLIDEWQKLDAQIRGSATFLIDRFPHMQVAKTK